MEIWYPLDRGRLWGVGNARHLRATSPKTYKVGYVFTVPKTGQINSVGFVLTEVSGVQSITVALEVPIESTGSTGGGPPGSTDDFYGSSAAGVIASPAVGWNQVDLATPATAVAGDMVAMSIKFTSTEGDLYLGGCIPLDYNNTAVTQAHGFPQVYMVHGTQVSRSSNFAAPISVKYDDWIHIPGSMPITLGSYLDIWGDTDNERGNLIIPPATFAIKGFYFVGQVLGYAPVKFTLYGKNEGELASIEVETLFFHTPPNNSWYQLTLPEKDGAVVQISKDGEYYLTVKQNGTTAFLNPHINVPYFDVGAEAVMGGMPEGARVYGIKRPAAGGAWTEEKTRRYRIGLIADFPTGYPPSGGGGNYAHTSLI